VVTADYRYPVASIGPVSWAWNEANFTTLPGIVLAFGKRAKIGDKVAIVVYPDRVKVAEAFGGKFEVSFELDVIAMDPIQMEEIADFAVMSIWGVKKAALEFEGIEVVDVSMGGEAEDVYDETADLYYYQGSLSMQLRADWEIHVPVPLTISKVSSNLPAGTPSSLFYATAPAIAGRNTNFERIA
jgi:hypothetical protein